MLISLFLSLALVTWNILAYLIAYKQYLELQKLTIPMILCCLLHTIYIVHYFLDETVVLNMVDFTSEHFGWMLIFGNIILYVFLTHTRTLSFFLFYSSLFKSIRNFCWPSKC